MAFVEPTLALASSLFFSGPSKCDRLVRTVSGTDGLDGLAPVLATWGGVAAVTTTFGFGGGLKTGGATTAFLPSGGGGDDAASEAGGRGCGCGDRGGGGLNTGGAMEALIVVVVVFWCLFPAVMAASLAATSDCSRHRSCTGRSATVLPPAVGTAAVVVAVGSGGGRSGPAMLEKADPSEECCMK